MGKNVWIVKFLFQQDHWYIHEYTVYANMLYSRGYHHGSSHRPWLLLDDRPVHWPGFRRHLLATPWAPFCGRFWQNKQVVRSKRWVFQFVEMASHSTEQIPLFVFFEFFSASRGGCFTGWRYPANMDMVFDVLNRLQAGGSATSFDEEETAGDFQNGPEKFEPNRSTNGRVQCMVNVTVCFFFFIIFCTEVL